MPSTPLSEFLVLLGMADADEPTAPAQRLRRDIEVAGLRIEIERLIHEARQRR